MFLFLRNIRPLSCMYGICPFRPNIQQKCHHLNLIELIQKKNLNSGRPISVHSPLHFDINIFIPPYYVSPVHWCELPSECLGNCICTNIELICTHVTLIWIWLKPTLFWRHSFRYEFQTRNCSWLSCDVTLVIVFENWDTLAYAG